MITISHQVATTPGIHPVAVDRRKTRKVDLHHLSWSRIQTEAIIQHSNHEVADPNQAWLLSEFIRYIEDPKSGALDFEDMGSSWVVVRNGAVNAAGWWGTGAGLEEAAALGDRIEGAIESGRSGAVIIAPDSSTTSAVTATEPRLPSASTAAAAGAEHREVLAQSGPDRRHPGGALRYRRVRGPGLPSLRPLGRRSTAVSTCGWGRTQSCAGCREPGLSASRCMMNSPARMVPGALLAPGPGRTSTSSPVTACWQHGQHTVGVNTCPQSRWR